jgi:hypothetical protein
MYFSSSRWLVTLSTRRRERKAGVLRGEPVEDLRKVDQGIPAATPHVGHETDDICLSVSSLFFMTLAAKMCNFGHGAAILEKIRSTVPLTPWGDTSWMN